MDTFLLCCVPALVDAYSPHCSYCQALELYTEDVAALVPMFVYEYCPECKNWMVHI